MLISPTKFNNIGIKSNNNIPFNKTKKRIAIIGDSMTENKQLSNDEILRQSCKNYCQNMR